MEINRLLCTDLAEVKFGVCYSILFSVQLSDVGIFRYSSCKYWPCCCLHLTKHLQQPFSRCLLQCQYRCYIVIVPCCLFSITAFLHFIGALSAIQVYLPLCCILLCQLSISSCDCSCDSFKIGICTNSFLYCLIYITFYAFMNTVWFSLNFIFSKPIKLYFIDNSCN